MNWISIISLFLINTFFFSFAISYAFFVPGFILIRYLKLTLPFHVKLISAFVVGMTLWGLQGFVFGWLAMRWATYLYLVVFGLFGVLELYRNRRNIKKIDVPNLNQLDVLAVIILIAGVVLQGSAVFLLGVPHNDGLFFCCGNTNDNLFHLALTDRLIWEFPPQQPGMIGEYVRNYHYLGDLVSAELIRIFHLPLISTSLQLLPLFLSLFLGLGTIAFCNTLKLNRMYKRWLLFFLYFGGDLVYMGTSIMRRSISFDMSSLEDGAKFLVNTPRAFSIIVFLSALTLLMHWIVKKEKKAGILAAVLFAATIGLKVYTGFFSLAGLSLLVLYYAVKRKFFVLVIFLLTLGTSLLLYLPVNKNAGGFYFTGFHIFQNFIVQPWLMLDRLELARIIFFNDHKMFRVFQFNMVFMLIYVVLNFGTKLLGFIQTKKSLSVFPKEFHIFMIGGIIPSAILGFFFQQYAGGTNTFNFLVSIFILGSFYTALTMMSFTQGKKLKLLKTIFAIIIISLTLPRVIHIFAGQINRIINADGYSISSHELDAYEYLKKRINPTSKIVVDPYEFILDQTESPYISAFIHHPTFFSGKRIIESHGINVIERQVQLDTILSSTHSAEFIQLMGNPPIDIILTSLHPRMSTLSAEYFDTVYSNEKYMILEVKTN